MAENKGQGTILVIDDDKGLLRLVEMALNSRGFNVRTANGGEPGLESFQTDPPDLVVLDVMMPGMDGRTVCKQIRKQSNVPILFLTARGQIQARIEGLMIGADDYLIKPFDVKELIARIEALLRRTRLPVDEPPQIMRFGSGSLVINHQTRQVFVNSNTIHLTPTEYELLRFLTQRAGHILSVNAIYNAVWSYESDADPKTVRWYIWRLRQKVEPDPNNPQFILTEPGIGYRFSSI
jgi:two-component system KDP operon response regulator KdpE